MGLELGRVLLLSDAITPQALSRALLASVKEGVSLVRALLVTEAVDPARLEEELARAAPDAPFQRHPVPVLDLATRLPPRMCQALLALPVRRDPRTGTVDVAMADVLDTHAADEIGFHLAAPVRAVRAPIAALEEGIARVRAALPEEAIHPPPPSRTIRGAPIVSLEADEGPHVSERPMPLVTHSSEPAPLADIPIPLSKRVDIPRITAEPDVEPDDEPVVELRRTKSSQSMRAVKPAEPASPSSVPPPSAPASAPTFQVHQALRDMTKVEARDPLMALVVAAIETAAPKAALFAVKRDAYVGWLCTPAFGDRSDLSEVRIDVRVPSVFATTAAAGAFVGPLLRNGPHAPLFKFMSSARPEVLAVSIKAAGKPAVVVLAHDVPDARQAMVVMTEVSRVAGEALERLVRTARGEPLSVRGGPISRR